MTDMKSNSIKIICQNRKAYHEYTILETLQAGIALTGTEVKSIREGKIKLDEGWIDITEHEEAILRQVHINPYHHGNIYNHAETRERKLLLKKKEIRRLANAVHAKGMSIIPLKVLFIGSMVKIQIGLAKGKKDYDKREDSKKKDAERDIQRAFRH
ncbi:MAG: SsrA-binding protein SmpB [Oligoflexales bacterium]|nr:SsrA-binding protein SmpB [Oligoflexales bacterium]